MNPMLRGDTEYSILSQCVQHPHSAVLAVPSYDKSAVSWVRFFSVHLEDRLPDSRHNSAI
jgi:hypothetical protein